MELPNGLVRQYSLCNDASETHRYLIGVLLDAGTRGGSKSVHHDVAVGSTIRISEPRIISSSWPPSDPSCSQAASA